MELGCREAAYPATGDRKVKGWATRIKRVARPSPARWRLRSSLLAPASRRAAAAAMVGDNRFFKLSDLMF